MRRAISYPPTAAQLAKQAEKNSNALAKLKLSEKKLEERVKALKPQKIQSTGKAPKRQNRGNMVRQATPPIDPDAARFISQSTNLFSDYNARLAAPPDEYQGRSVMVPWSFDLDVTAPAGGTLAIFSLPLTEWSLFDSINCNTTGWAVGFTKNAWFKSSVSSQQRLLGPINIVTMAGTAPILPTVSNFTAAPTYFNDFASGLPETTRPRSWQAGRYRLVAAAWEAINTTSAANLGGTVTVGRYSQVQQDDCAFVATTTSAWNATVPVLAGGADIAGGVPVVRGTYPPTELGELLYVDPNALSWTAARGMYVNVPIDHENNPPGYSDSQCTQFCSEVSPGSAAGGAGFFSTFTAPYANIVNSNENPRYTSQGGVNTYDVGIPYKIGRAPLEGVSSFVTGLNVNNTFKIRIKLVYEVFGTPGDSLATLCEPRPRSRDDVIEMVMRLVRELPVACPQDLNPEGEWWQMVLTNLNKFLPAAASVLSAVAPELAPIGAAAVFAGKAIQQVVDYDRRSTLIRAYGKR